MRQVVKRPGASVWRINMALMGCRKTIIPALTLPKTEDEFDVLAESARKLAFELRNNADHPLHLVLKRMGELLEEYEKLHDPNW
jgi:hypothetical protein